MLKKSKILRLKNPEVRSELSKKVLAKAANFDGNWKKAKSIMMKPGEKTSGGKRGRESFGYSTTKFSLCSKRRRPLTKSGNNHHFALKKLNIGEKVTYPKK